MYRRRRSGRDKIAFSFDSFLDVVANVIGIVVRLIGGTGARVISKLAMLILAALAVMFIRSGLALMSAAWGKT